ncbi:allophanate hydrolase [Nocardioides gansuensis]|uniref:Allophanate hydrolase n=1 Tax=Nocardioides gansuensis TaxID=2138300 RepID=A0A2T8FD97_9ACTN|nr:biotin-dependent carboxyltransferase family protein [Nocardioides gansuensis]PVG83675.1 allophanate hydrolase [Nocardioides gansuensis]
MTLVVLDPGALTTVQDRGRRGWAHLGVPRAGALDADAAALANRLVGNEPDAALLETTLTGVRVRLEEARTLAVTGAECDVVVGGRSCAFAEPVSVRAGAEVQIGPARRGVRSYLAVSGGLAVAPVLGSRSTDTLAWVGPPLPQAGDKLPLGPVAGPPRAADVVVRRPREAVLRLHRGPRADWVTSQAWDALDGAAYTVGADSNRIGLRLEGRAVERVERGELASEGVVLGAVQLPPSGQPVVFLHDHPVTGGYPVIAVVDPDDLGVCAQLRPGEEVALRALGDRRRSHG